MTIWQADDRQARKYFSKRPTFILGHDIFEGPNCRAPKKGDRVIKNYKINLSLNHSMSKYYPKIMQVKPW